MQQKVFLATPPFTQLNTPYPATAYLKGFLNTQNIPCYQADLGIDVINALFSKRGLTKLFEAIADVKKPLDDNCNRIVAMQSVYINTIDEIIAFLQDKNPNLAYLICTGNYLPEAQRFEQLADLEWAFGSMGTRDKARHLATLYLEDISDLIVAAVDPYFGFSRYAERLGSSAHSFDELYAALQAPPTYTDGVLFEILKEKIEKEQPTLFALSIPFPGNLYSGFRCAQYIKQHFPNIKIVMGGGYPNTELREISDPRVFEFLDFITLDDGETPMLHLVEMLEGKRTKDLLKRTFYLQENTVLYCNTSLSPDVKQMSVGTPDYSDLPLDQYLSVIEVANPMHRLWSDGRWNKLTLAHGCYWGKCTFCDITLDYIKNYEATTAAVLVDRMQEIILQTGQSGFHFVDEAAPPAMMREVALEILRRNLTITWWTNIRFEKSFTRDLCHLLAASGCIAVSGGLEVASDRLLKLINKGVTVAQVAQVADNFTEAGIMVHAYLMYGFPTQTEQETIDSLEVVRQLFEHNIVQSGFWHQFAMTAHSPVGLNPEQFGAINIMEEKGRFANNDLPHEDPEGCDHVMFAEGLRKSLYNYMHGMCFDFDLQEWFDFDVPETLVAPDFIANVLHQSAPANIKPSSKIVWLGLPPTVQKISKKIKGKTIQTSEITLCNKRCTLHVALPDWQADALFELLERCSYTQGKTFTVADLQDIANLATLLNSHEIAAVKEMGLVIL